MITTLKLYRDNFIWRVDFAVIPIRAAKEVLLYGETQLPNVLNDKIQKIEMTENHKMPLKKQETVKQPTETKPARGNIFKNASQPGKRLHFL
jgi:hypothetical protein